MGMAEEEMENLNINTLDDLAASSASLEINRINSGSGVQIAIRGIASSPGSLGIEQSVAVMIDNVYFPQGRVTDHRINLTLHKLDEFLKGEIHEEMNESLRLKDQDLKLKNLA